jgi:hypothetical protein
MSRTVTLTAAILAAALALTAIVVFVLVTLPPPPEHDAAALTPAAGPGADTRPADDGDRPVEARPPARKPTAADAQRAAASDPRLEKLAAAYARAAARGRATAPAETGAEATATDDPAGAQSAARVWKTDREGIQGAIGTAIPAVKECYEAWLGLNPELGGRIVAHFRIAAPEDGAENATVTDVEVGEGSLGNQFLEGCVLAALGDLTFEIPEEGEVEVNYPFKFSNRPQ